MLNQKLTQAIENVEQAANEFETIIAAVDKGLIAALDKGLIKELPIETREAIKTAMRKLEKTEKLVTDILEKTVKKAAGEADIAAAAPAPAEAEEEAAEAAAEEAAEEAEVVVKAIERRFKAIETMVELLVQDPDKKTTIAELKNEKAEIVGELMAEIATMVSSARTKPTRVAKREREYDPVMTQLDILEKDVKKLKHGSAREAGLNLHKDLLALGDTYKANGDLSVFKTKCKATLSNNNPNVKKLKNYVDIKRVLLNLAALIFTLSVAHIVLSVSKGRLSFFDAPQAAGSADKLGKNIENFNTPKPGK